MRGGGWWSRWGALVLGLFCLVAAHLVAQLAHARRPAADTEALAATEGDLGEIFVELEPGEFAGTLLLGGMRGLVADLLWLKADAATQEGRYYQSVALYQLISRIQPRFEQSWEYMAHDLAYNIAAEVPPEDRWPWFVAGIEALGRGVQRNPRSRRLLYKLGWFFQHKGESMPERVLDEDWSGLLNPILLRYPEAVEPIAVGEAVGRADAGGWWIRPRTGSFGPDQSVLVVGRAGILGRGRVVAVDPEGGVRVVAAGLEVEAPVIGVVARLSNFELALRLYRAHLALAQRLPEERAFSVVRRIMPLTIERDGNRLRNAGHHLAALERYLDALADWQEVVPWLEDPAHDMPEGSARIAQASYERNEGDLRRDAALLARALAPDPATGRAMAEAIMDRDLVAARSLLLMPGWRTVATTGGGVRWYDELPAADSAP